MSAFLFNRILIAYIFLQMIAIYNKFSYFSVIGLLISVLDNNKESSNKFRYYK